MFFVTYYELNDNMDPTIIADLVQKFMEKKIFPTEGVKIISFLLTTENWGIVISEDETEEAMFRDFNMWRIAMPGIFKTVKTAVGMEVAKVIPLLVKLSKEIKD
jgi:hypothetical protein